MAIEADHARGSLLRLLYKHAKELQLALDNAEKLWLESISVQDLMRKFKHTNLKRSGCSSRYRGVHKIRGGGSRPWCALLTTTANNRTQVIYLERFKDEDLLPTHGIMPPGNTAAGAVPVLQEGGLLPYDHLNRS